MVAIYSMTTVHASLLEDHYISINKITDFSLIIPSLLLNRHQTFMHEITYLYSVEKVKCILVLLQC